MDLAEAERLAMGTDYAIESQLVKDSAPINVADAAAFFLEGYIYAHEHSLSKGADSDGEGTQGIRGRTSIRGMA